MDDNQLIAARSPVETLASKIRVLEGIIGLLASRVAECEDGYYHEFLPKDIERGLQKGVSVKHMIDGGAVLSVGMGS
jgi:hypothetical protein